MPFPWNKNKNRVTRISQIVADLQSPNRRASLVVQTGFPTSLIDLFVNNRTRFSKPRSNKPPPATADITYSPPPPPPPSPATSPPPMTPPPVSNIPPTESPRPGPLIAENAVPDRVRECGSGSGPGATVLVVKVLLVAVLVASVERLTVGITVSAFSLLLLEYAGKRVVSCLRPCSDPSVTESLLRRVSSHLGFNQKVRIQLKMNEDREPAAELNRLISNVDEIEVVEANCGELDSSMVMESLPLASECKVRGSRSGRFKSKMVKKLVPKKFRGSKKEKRDKQNEAESGSEVSSGVGEEEKLQSLELEEDVRREHGGSKRLSFLLRTTEHECVDDDDDDDNGEGDCGGNGITCSKESPLEEEKRIESVGVVNSGYSYTILVIITLVGLLVGRFPALILTMAWCFLLKIVKVLYR